MRKATSNQRVQLQGQENDPEESIRCMTLHNIQCKNSKIPDVSPESMPKIAYWEEAERNTCVVS